MSNAAAFGLHALGADVTPWCADIARAVNGEHAELRGRMAGCDVLFLVQDGAPPLVAMPWQRWVELLRAAGMSPPLETAA